MVKIIVQADYSKLRKIMENMKGTPTRILHDGVEYGIYQEFGTSRGVLPHSFITPAIEAVRPAFESKSAWQKVIESGDLTPEDFVEKIARDAEGIAKKKAPYRTGALKNSIAVHPPEEFFGGK